MASRSAKFPDRRGAASLLAALLCLAAGPALAQSLTLTFVDSFAVHDKDAGFTEPSGLALAADGSHLWSVSDDTKKVFRLGFDGKLLDGPEIALPAKGFEGIAATADGTRLLAVREEKNVLVGIEIATGEVVFERPLALLGGYEPLSLLFENGPKNKGLEGVSIDPASGRVFVVKEGDPRLLLEIAPDLGSITAHRMLNAAAGFAESLSRDGKLDVSGLAYDPDRKLHWIISDRGRKLFLLGEDTPAATHAPLLVTVEGEEREIEHAEGVALDAARGRFYVISDDGRHSRLYVFEISGG